ncbi:hypothetical protein N405_00750 [Helicobacter pylori FD568]|nr:hypothetical protein N405_00750 [Helicobacter pylori FD568]
MLDKVTKTCYNLIRPFFCLKCSFFVFILFLVKLLKGFYQSHS